MSGTYDRRTFLSRSAVAAGGVAAATIADQLGAGPAGALTRGGTLKVGVSSEQVKPINPGYGSLDTSGFMYARAIYDPLCVVSSDGQSVYPYLAKSITHNSTYTKWTITARPGVKFHNGSKCDANAIYKNLVACYNSYRTGPALKVLVASITHTPGSNTVVINARRPWTTLPYSLAEQQIGFIAEPSTLGPRYLGNPIGTGPFIFSSWSFNSKFVCTRNPVYWRLGGLPYLKQIEFHPVPDGAVRNGELTSGTLDIIHQAQGQQIKDFASFGSSYTYVSDTTGKLAYSPSSNCIMLNVRKAPFNDINFRRACAAAIDRATFSAVIDAGESTPVDGLFDPGSPYYNKPAYPSFNLSQAASYLSKSSITKPNRHFTLTCVNSPIVVSAATLVQTFLSKIGVSVTLAPVSQNILIRDAISHSFQALTWSQFGGVSPDLDYPWLSTKTGLNFAGNFDARIETAMISGMAATTKAARVKAWSYVNDQVDADLPYLWLSRSIWGIASSSRVQGWRSFTEPLGQPVLQPNQGVLFFTETWKS